MTEAQEKAWNCLREDEKQSLFLQLSYGKSAWEAGTIMKRPHYKYIEIRDRAQKFFELFTDFFEKHSSIFRPGAPLPDDMKDFFEGCLEKRLSREDAARISGETFNLAPRVRNTRIIKYMKLLKESQEIWDQDTRALIIEFDRWNNFRILPGILQAPSAYKRRVNTKYKIYLRYMLKNFPIWAHDKLMERYGAKNSKSTPKHPKYFTVFISNIYENGYEVRPIKASEEAIREFSKYYLYVFKEEIEADIFGMMICTFRSRTKQIKTGQVFWNEFREVVESAINYKQINNVEFYVSNLDQATNTRRTHKKNSTK